MSGRHGRAGASRLPGSLATCRCFTELRLGQLLDDALVLALMKADGVDRLSLKLLLRKVAEQRAAKAGNQYDKGPGCRR